MSRSVRSRFAGALWFALVVAAGLGSRRPGLPSFCSLYLGDVLWGAMFFVLYGCCWPAAGAWRVWRWAAATTVLIELSQLWKAPWLAALRATTAGKLLLGDTFLWSDVMCVVLGATVAALVDESYRLRRERRAGHAFSREFGEQARSRDESAPPKLHGSSSRRAGRVR
jgi:hypothetical protein